MSAADPLPDETLVEHAKTAPEGDTRAFETLVTRHQDMVVTNCRYLSRSADDAQDLAQEVFVKAYFGLARFEGRSPFKGWIQKIKLNHCLSFLRKKKRASFVDVEDEAMEGLEEMQVDPQAERNLEAAGDRERIQQILDDLPDTLRLPLVLCDVDGLNYQDIADQLGIGLSATKMRIKRGREEFRKRFDQAERQELQQAGEGGA